MPSPFAYRNESGLTTWSWWDLTACPTAQGRLPTEVFVKLRGGELSGTGNFRTYATESEAVRDEAAAAYVVRGTKRPPGSAGELVT